MQHLQESVKRVEKQIFQEETKQELKILVTEMKKIGIEKLPYSYSALKRFIDPETMNVHYNRHYKGYVEKLNILLSKRKGDKDLEKIIRNISRYPKGIRDNAGGAFNHALFWNMLSPQPTEVGPEMTKMIKKEFGSFMKFKKQFEDVAKLRFGSGWVWLILTNKGTLKIMSTPNQDNPLMNIIEGGGYPLLGLDLWEHAYYLKYKNKRDEYIKNFWTAVNWPFVENMYTMKTETSLLESVSLGKALKETKSESCSRVETEVYRMLFNVNKQVRNIYKNTINDVLKQTFPEKYHTKTEGGEIPGIYNLEKPGRSVINYMNTNYSVFCIMVRDLNRVVTNLGESPLNFIDKTSEGQVIEVKRMCNLIETFRDRIFDLQSGTFKNIMNTLKEKDSIGTKRETSAKMVIENNMPDAKVTVTAGAGKEKDAFQKIDMEIYLDEKKYTAQVKGFGQLFPDEDKLTVTKTGEVEKYNVDWMVFVRGKHVIIFKNNPNIVLGQYVFDKEDLLYDFGR